jgi:hypothetical protein
MDCSLLCEGLQTGGRAECCRDKLALGAVEEVGQRWLGDTQLVCKFLGRRLARLFVVAARQRE